MGLRLGIYGAGQLGAYLCQAAKTLGVTCTVIAPTADSPANQHADHVIVAPLDDLAACNALISCCDLVTFELEDIAGPVLERLAEAVDQTGLQVFPKIEHLRLLQNKFLQKQWYVEHEFPTAKFVDCLADTEIDVLADEFGLPFVQKTHRGGYDGRGVQVIRDASGAAVLWPGKTFIEKFIAPRRELAVLVARSTTGEEAVYPVVEMDFDDEGHILRHVLSPAPVSLAISEQAQSIALAFVRQLDGIGLFAIEMFLQEDQQLLINEVAPRVHNTGHLGIEAHVTSQYEQHLRAIAGMPLGSTEQLAPAAMVNILFSESIADACATGRGVLEIGDDTYVHWYGKKGSQELRKMGHITATGASIEDAQKKVDAALADLEGEAHT